MADDKTQGEVEMGYQHTLMYGRYTQSLGEYAREQGLQLREMEKTRKEEKMLTKELRTYRGKWTSRFLRILAFVWRNTFAKIGEDWVFLALLGIIMALLSFMIDYGIKMCTTAQLWLYRDLATHPALQYLAWICLPVFLVLFSAGFVHILAPQAIGSGIPEMKTILRGVVLKEYLTFRTLIAKSIGLTATLGSGMPLGKEGPLVHIASIVATLMSKLVTSFKGIYENESRNSEMLAAACAVGVSCSFAAPIGGVLFSIEVTSVYFAIRNYWRGFFAAVFGALMFRLLAYWFTQEETITAVFKTNYQIDFPYDPQELFIYALVGAFGGLAGAFFVWCHRNYVLFMRKNKKISSFLQKNRFIYPGLVSLFIATVYFPLGLGQFLASTLTTQQQINSLFSNFTWLKDDLTVEEETIVSHWINGHTNLLVNLGTFSITTVLLTILASTLPVPSGSLIPIFKTGAAFGRLIGEAMHLWFPEGLRIGSKVSPILPGGYAIVGAAAFSSGVTHSISICVIISEMTGQISHIVPIMIAVLVSNAISTLLQPSLYDSIIMIKKLPYLPDILPSSSGAYSIFVEDFMVRNIKYIWNGMSYKELKQSVKDGRKVRSFPLVDSPTNMVLLGSIQRTEIINLIEKHIGRERRLQAAAQLQMEAEAKLRAQKTTFHLGPPPEATIIRSPGAETTVVRRQSRFEVTPIADDFDSQQFATSPDPFMTPSSVVSTENEEGSKSHPRKSILKKTSSFIFNNSGPMVSPGVTPYSTVTAGEESRIRTAIDAIFRKSTSILDGSKFSLGHSHSAGSLPTSPHTIKKVTLPKERIVDMSPQKQKEWEEMEMEKMVDILQHCRIDPAPFQLVERTSLLKVHSIFSLLGVNHAYVTTIGQLIGIVSLKELRKAIEDVNAGILPASQNQSLNSHELPNNAMHIIRENRDVSPGAPEDIETGPDPPGFSDSDDDSDNGPQTMSTVIADQATVSEESSVVEHSNNPPPTVTFTNTTNKVRPIYQRENSIKLIVIGAPVAANNAAISNDEQKS